MAKLFTLFLVLALASAVACGARKTPAKGLTDQKNYLGYGGGYAGVGNNGIPFGGVGGGVAGDGGNVGFGLPGGLPGGGIGGLPGGGLGGGVGGGTGVGGSSVGLHFP